jgi:predicted dinucleotide-binding enzyme
MPECTQSAYQVLVELLSGALLHHYPTPHGHPRMLGLSLSETLERHSAQYRQSRVNAGTGVFTEMLRKFLGICLASAAAVALAVHAGMTGAAPADGAPLKIGIIGAGHIGGTLAKLWVAAGHDVLISSRHPEELRPLAQSLGPKARVGTPREAALFGDVLLVSVPYGALPQIGQDLKAELAGKIVLDTGNPYPQRDGDMAIEARRIGTGVASPRYLPGVRLVRAFNAINSGDLASKAHRPGEPIAIPLAGDDPEALAVAQRLVRDAGFEPVVVGSLSRAREFDVGTPVYTRLMTAPQLRQALGLK